MEEAEKGYLNYTFHISVYIPYMNHELVFITITLWSDKQLVNYHYIFKTNLSQIVDKESGFCLHFFQLL